MAARLLTLCVRAFSTYPVHRTATAPAVNVVFEPLSAVMLASAPILGMRQRRAATLGEDEPVTARRGIPEATVARLPVYHRVLGVIATPADAAAELVTSAGGAL